MFGLDRKAARYTWTAVIVLLTLVLVYVIRKTLFVFVVSLLFAYLLSPLVDLFDRALPASRTRAPALALSYVMLLAILIGGGIMIGSRVVDQANALAAAFPQWLSTWETPNPTAPAIVNSLKQSIVETVRRQLSEGANTLFASLPRAGSKFLSFASDLVYIVIVPILGFFFLKDGRQIRLHLLAAIEDEPRRAMLDELTADIHLLLAHYMRALFILSLATLTAYSLFLSILGTHYALLLGAISGLLEFIPMIGPLAAALLVLVVGGLSGSSILVLLIFLTCYRLFQDYVLSPYIMGAGVELHPLLVLFGVFAGAELAGVPGAFLSVPILALVRVLYRRMKRSREARRLSSIETPQ